MTRPDPTAPLAGLLPLLATEPALEAVLGRRDAVLAVPEPARALAVAGIVAAVERRPVVVATPTQQEAERLAGDLKALVGDDEVALFPAWETLPFERVSSRRSRRWASRAAHAAWRLR